MFSHSSIPQLKSPLQLDKTAPPFTLPELKYGIYSFDANKAPKIDEMDRNTIRNIFKIQIFILLTMCNKLLHLNYFPNDWKIDELVFSLKLRKPTKEADSYRPIALLPIFGKVFEKLLLCRINYSLKVKGEKFIGQQGSTE